MQSSSKSCFAKPLSHIYIEHAIATHPRTVSLVHRFPDAQNVYIDSYKHVFNRSHQNFDLQKKTPKLILAQKQVPHVYPFSEKCQMAAFEKAVYVTPVLGCRFDCDFCFLHGMYNSANPVIFVNIEEMQTELSQKAAESNTPLFVSLSYETDLLALEPICEMLPDWIAFSRRSPNLFFECRTRSGLFQKIAKEKPQQNFLLSWSLNPDEIITQFEHGAPNLNSRLRAARQALAAGWPVRLCFDPIIPIPDWQSSYRRLFKHVFDTLPARQLYDVTTGPFRMGSDFFKRIRKQRPWCDLYYKEMIIGTDSFNNVIVEGLQQYVPMEKVVIWKSQL
ncbi:MAG: hypothetical protein JXX14_02845 [Deltaproteobacteria bacterium]|nr:hypothetical protein [Deltaproteobacteria bacterium]